MRTMTFVFLAVICAPAGAQEATELFIPLGASPELSKKVTVVGTIESVDAEKRTVVVGSEGGSVTATVTEKTRVFIDLSKRKRSNRYGVFGDLVEGARVEILYQGRNLAASGPAEWIKVEPPSS